MRFYNTLTNKKEEFVQIEENKGQDVFLRAYCI